MNNNVLQVLKENEEDFEFYPTTEEILLTINKDILQRFGDYGGEYRGVSVLDCGAGDGRALESLSHGGDMFAIEKSQTLIASLHQDVMVDDIEELFKIEIHDPTFTFVLVAL